MITTGTKGYSETTVTKDNTAIAMGSGMLPVFATPAMIALIENAAANSIVEQLEEGTGTVGTYLEVNHTSASPVGMKITCESKVTEVNGREITFTAVVSDEKGEIGNAVHKRFIIKNASFLEKANAKIGE
ncbi:MAG: thioesterase family protein [Lachnospiraceae bacterium]|nr:thioesterase family protein [Lachnospiraceae bacterium]